MSYHLIFVTFLIFTSKKMLSSDYFRKNLRVFVTHNLRKSGLKILQDNFKDIDVQKGKLTRSQFLEHARAADIIVSSASDSIDKEVLACKNLKLVSQVAAGMENIDVEEATKRKILVANTHTSLEDTCADTIWALMMACCRRIVEAHTYVMDGKWTEKNSDLFMGLDMHHKTIGIIGAGHIGQAVARRAKGFDMKVLFNTLNPKISTPIGDVLRKSDFITVAVPLTKMTRHLIGARELKLMKPTSIIANIGRGPVIDTDALADALEKGQIYGAALDVTDPEPLPRNHKLLRQKNVIIAPHIGSATEETRNAMAVEAANACVQFLNGQKISNCSNPEIYYE